MCIIIVLLSVDLSHLYEYHHNIIFQQNRNNNFIRKTMSDIELRHFTSFNSSQMNHPNSPSVFSGSTSYPDPWNEVCLSLLFCL